MKLKNFVFGAFAALALASCSSDVTESVQQPVWDKDGKGYLSFSIQMPKDAGTRANDNFDEGLASEYEVKDVALLLFKGTDEASAVYQQFVDMSDIDFGDPSHATNITLDKKWVAKINGMDLAAGEKIYALAVVNRNLVFSKEHNTIGGEDMSGKTFAYLQTLIMNTTVNANGDGTGKNAGFWGNGRGFLMLNAPLCDTQGSTTTTPSDGAKVSILQDVTTSVKSTKTEAQEAPAKCIYVERAVAKVTVEYTNATGTTKDSESNDLFTWKLDEWRLDHTNTLSYLVRNMSNFATTFQKKSHQTGNVYRMIGGISVKHDNPISMGDVDDKDRYRTYFAIDPNYGTESATTGKYNPGVASVSFGSATPQYCAENVFDVDHQIWGQTTRVLVKATLTPASGDSYYGNPGENKFYSNDAVKTLATDKAISNFRKGVEKFRNAGLLQGTITGATSTNIKAVDGVEVVLPVENITLVAGKTAADIVAAGVAGVTDETTLNAHLNTFKNQTILAKDMDLSYYSGGSTYYQIRIKHFGDDLTPWNNETSPEYDSESPKPSAGYTNAYPAGAHRECNYLGRYGVLRNNWYNITLGTVVKLGYAELSDLKLDGTGKVDPETPDDNITKEQWINAEVNILSWAKRLQNNNLGED